MARILIVDDHLETCRVMSMLVRHLGHEAHSLNSGTEVSPYIAERPVDLIILDIMMPGMSGMDVLRELRRDGAHPAPVIMMTAITDPLTRREAMELGAADYWIKATIDLADLEKRINAHLSGPSNAVSRTVRVTAVRPAVQTMAPEPTTPPSYPSPKGPKATLGDLLAGALRRLRPMPAY